MTVFNKFAKELDESVKAYFRKYRAAEKKLKDIDAEIEEVTADIREFQRTKNRVAEMKARARLASLQVEREAAAESFRKVQKENGAALVQLGEIRDRLESDANKKFALDPENIDQRFMQLANSGLMKPADYEALYEKYENDQNVTMMRLVGNAAGTLAEAESNNGNRKKAAEFNRIAVKANENTPAGVCKRFDELTSVAKYALGDPKAPSYNRSIPNPYFMDRWDDLCGETIEEF